MTKADLYKRRSKNKQRKSSTSEPGTSSQSDTPMEVDDNKETYLYDTINNLKNRMNKNSIENDVELIKANTQDTPINETDEPLFENDEVPPVKPVEKTYSKSRSKLDEYIYIESSQGLEGTEVAFPKTNRKKKSQSPVPRKKRKIETRSKKVEPKTPEKRGRGRPKKVLDQDDSKSRVTKESIENDKTIVTRATRKRKHEEIEKPVLREKGQNGRQSRKNSEKETRKVARPKRKTDKVETKIDIEPQNVRMTRSRRRRLEISLSPSEVKSVMPAFSFESDRRVNSIESNKSKIQTSNAKGKKNSKKTQNKAKKPPIRKTRARANRR